MKTMKKAFLLFAALFIATIANAQISPITFGPKVGYQTTKLSTNRDGLNINITLGENEYYVLGDNRLGSLDSRNFGPINKEQIDARLFMILGQCKDNLECNTNDKCLCDKKYFWPRFY